MGLLLRLLLVICLVAPAAPDVAARLHAAADDTTSMAHAEDLPPCHEAAHAAPAPPDAPAPHCCDGLDAGCGCGCLHAAGLPVALAWLGSLQPAERPAATVRPGSPPPPPTRAERPPIA